MNNLGLKLKKLRKEKGLNQDELAQILGVGKTTISNYETGYTRPPSAMIIQLADFFSVSTDYILNDDPIPYVIDDTPSKIGSHLRENTAVAYGERNIPVYSSLSGDAKDASLLFQIKLPDAMIGGGDFMALKVSGDRMDRAALADGSIAVIRQQDFADNGDIIAVSLSGNPAFFSRYYLLEDAVVLLSESSNPIYKPVLLSPQDKNHKILGKVIKSIQSIL